MFKNLKSKPQSKKLTTMEMEEVNYIDDMMKLKRKQRSNNIFFVIGICLLSLLAATVVTLLFIFPRKHQQQTNGQTITVYDKNDTPFTIKGVYAGRGTHTYSVISKNPDRYFFVGYICFDKTEQNRICYLGWANVTFSGLPTMLQLKEDVRTYNKYGKKIRIEIISIYEFKNKEEQELFSK
jgi:hypothetical protein